MALDRGEPALPPADLAAREIHAFTELSLRWQRIGQTRFAPLFYSQSDGWRFSAPDMPGVLYLGDSAQTCFWEVFWDDLATRSANERRLDFAKVQERSLWELEIPSGLRVVDTTNAATQRAMSAHGGTFLGSYAVCQRWARALRQHPARFDGILYASVRDMPGRCLALFAERVGGLVWKLAGPGTPLLRSVPLAALVETHGLRIIR